MKHCKHCGAEVEYYGQHYKQYVTRKRRLFRAKWTCHARHTKQLPVRAKLTPHGEAVKIYFQLQNRLSNKEIRRIAACLMAMAKSGSD